MEKFIMQTTLVVVVFSCGITCNDRFLAHLARHFPKVRTTNNPPMTTPGPVIYWEAFPSEGPTRYLKGKRNKADTSETKENETEVKDPKSRQLDSLGGGYLFDFRPPRGAMTNEVFGNGLDDKPKRYLSSLGGMQLHGFKRALSSLGDMQLHGSKRALSSLGGMQLYGDKRALSSLGGMQLYGDKRALSSLGGMQLHGSKRALSSLGGMQLHGYKRALSSLGGMHLYGDKRALSSLGDMQLHGFKRDGGENPFDESNMEFSEDNEQNDTEDTKRALSSLGGMELYGGYKRALSSLGGSNLFAFKRDDSGEENAEKRGLSSLGGFNIQRYKRSEEIKNKLAGEEAKTASR